MITLFHCRAPPCVPKECTQGGPCSDIRAQSQISNTRRTKSPNLKCSSSRLAVVFVQYIEAKFDLRATCIPPSAIGHLSLKVVLTKNYVHGRGQAILIQNDPLYISFEVYVWFSQNHFRSNVNLLKIITDYFSISLPCTTIRSMGLHRRWEIYLCSDVRALYIRKFVGCRKHHHYLPATSHSQTLYETARCMRCVNKQNSQAISRHHIFM